MQSLIWLVPGLPLFGAALLLLGGKRTNAWGHLLGCLTALGSFAIGAGLFFTMLGKHGAEREAAERRQAPEQVPPGVGALAPEEQECRAEERQSGDKPDETFHCFVGPPLSTSAGSRRRPRPSGGCGTRTR
jgi:hypothetical protein